MEKRIIKGMIKFFSHLHRITFLIQFEFEKHSLHFIFHSFSQGVTWLMYPFFTDRLMQEWLYKMIRFTMENSAPQSMISVIKSIPQCTQSSQSLGWWAMALHSMCFFVHTGKPQPFTSTCSTWPCQTCCVSVRYLYGCCIMSTKGSGTWETFYVE